MQEELPKTRVVFNPQPVVPNPQPVTPQNNEKLQKQIQFYFSDANLLTDTHFLEKMRQQKKCWLSYRYLLKCRKIRQILRQTNTSLRGRKKKILRAAKESNLLKVRNKKIKRVHHFKKKASFQNMLYIESNKEVPVDQIILSIQNLLENHQSSIKSVKKGENWSILVTHSNQQKKYIQMQLRTNGESMGLKRILNGNEWKEEQKRFVDLRKKIFQHLKIKKSYLREMHQGVMTD